LWQTLFGGDRVKEQKNRAKGVNGHVEGFIGGDVLAE